MAVKIYSDFKIDDQKNQFSAYAYGRKSLKNSSALNTLKSIETIVYQDLECAYSSHNEYLGLSREALLVQLKQKAEFIRDGYLQKTRALSKMRRFFGNVAKKEKKVNDTSCRILNRIDNLITTPSLFELPNELVQNILGFLPISDLKKVAQVSKHSHEHTNEIEIQRAQKYGYEGYDSAEAKDYLKGLLQGVEILALCHHIPEKYIVHDQIKVNAEATLKNIKNISSEQERVELKTELNKALLRASKIGNEKAVHALLLLGADLNVVGVCGNTPLSLAVHDARRDVVKLLIEKGADVNIVNLQGNTPLHLVAKHGYWYPEITRLLLENGAVKSVDYQNHHGETPLHLAAADGLFEIAQLLLQFGADANLIDNHGNTPLRSSQEGFHSAGHLEMARLLLENGAAKTINHQSRWGETALHFAAMKGRFGLAKLLLEYGADPSIPLLGQTPREWAPILSFRIKRLLKKIERSQLSAPS